MPQTTRATAFQAIAVIFFYVLLICLHDLLDILLGYQSLKVHVTPLIINAAWVVAESTSSLLSFGCYIRHVSL